ncbi:hypothetical protein [Dyadobacter tibetensis]|uniref:hypothetical protein n=1 Tax=Dyadobacter tibetensis TaxID=1211851 RepID=UPI00046E560C|nr:hypothetical protein [Dyadobacter tibetensis]
MRLKAITELYIYKPRQIIQETLVVPERLIAYFKAYDNDLKATSYGYLWTKNKHKKVKLHLHPPLPKTDEVLTFTWNFTGITTDVSISVTEISSNLSKIIIIEKEWDSSPDGMAQYNKQMRIWSYFVVRLKLYLEHGLTMYKGNNLGGSTSV